MRLNSLILVRCAKCYRSVTYQEERERAGEKELGRMGGEREQSNDEADGNQGCARGKLLFPCQLVPHPLPSPITESMAGQKKQQSKQPHVI